MRLSILLFLIVSAPVFSAEQSYLFIPREDHPFFINSSTGEFSIKGPENGWPRVLNLSSAGDGRNVQLVAHDLPSFSLEDKQLVFWVRAENVGGLEEFWIYAADSNDFSNRIVYMISNDKTQLREGEWTRISLPLSAGMRWGTPDIGKLTAFQFWLKDYGTSPVSVDIGPVYLEDSDEESCIVMTFDDGWQSQLTEAAPIMSGYGFSGTAYIIPELIGKENYMKPEELKTLSGQYGWSLGGHYLMRMDGMSQPELDAALADQQKWFSDLGLPAHDFSYPNGAFNGELVKALSEYYNSGRTIIEYPEALPPGDAFMLKVFNIVPPIDWQRLENRLDSVSDRGELLIFVFHKIEEVSEYETELSVSDFRRICGMIAETEIPVKTMREVSENFTSESGFTAQDWNRTTIFQPASPTAEASTGSPAPVPDGTTSFGDKDPLLIPAAGNPGLEMKTQIDFSLDWRMVWGPGDSGAEYYTQLDDLHLYIQNELFEGTVLHASAGIEDVNFTDFSTGAIDGSFFYLNSLFVEQSLPLDIRVTAGYFSPDPVHKWLQVTRSAAIEVSLGQDITPSSLWIQLAWEGIKPFGIQAAAMPDIFGITDQLSGLQVLKYQQDLGVPNLFGSIWLNTENIDAEIAAALNGDALKIAAAGGYYHDFQPIRISASLGLKYTRGTAFTTYPDWDHINNALRISSGVSAAIPVSDFTVTPGLAYQAAIYGDGSVRNLGSLDIGIGYSPFELYSVLSFKNIAATVWGDTAGIEAGLIVDYNGVDFMAGYTMEGFNTLSGLYNNNETNNGGIDGIFLRIKATYW